jgi:hypothetical protein
VNPAKSGSVPSAESVFYLARQANLLQSTIVEVELCRVPEDDL